MLAKQPDARFASIGEVVAELEQLAGSSVDLDKPIAHYDGHCQPTSDHSDSKPR